MIDHHPRVTPAWPMPRRATAPAVQGRRGVAMLVVLIAVGTATVLCTAMLSATTLQAQAAATGRKGLQAEYLAESGLALAMHYLLKPELSPVALRASSHGPWVFYPGQPGLPLGSGTIAITVEEVEPMRYRVTATGSIPGTGGSESIRRSRRAVVRVRGEYRVRHAGAFNGRYALGTLTRFVGGGGVRGDDAYVGTASLASNDGRFYAGNGTTGGPVYPRPVYPRSATPTWNQTWLAGRFPGSDHNRPLGFVPTYVHDGVTYQARRLGSGSGTHTLSTAELRDDAASNPLNIWYADQPVRVSGVVRLDGSLILREADHDLTIAGDFTVTAPPGWPAVAVRQDVIWSGIGRRLEVNGLLYVGRRFGADSLLGSLCALDVRGALVGGRGTQVINPTTLLSAFHLRYDPSLAYIPDFTRVDPTPYDVTVETWD